MSSIWCLLALFTLLVTSTPVSQVQQNAVLPQCRSINPTITRRLHGCSTATRFCQSFMHSSTTRPTHTSTVTHFVTRSKTAVTSTTSTDVQVQIVPATVATTTYTAGTSTVTAQASTSTVTSYVPDPSNCEVMAINTSDAAKVKRAATPRHTPSCGVRPFLVNQVSAGCSCLLFPTVTTTAQKTTTSTVTTMTSTIVKNVVPASPAGITITSTFTPLTTTIPYITTTTTLSGGPCPTPDLSCQNQGISWAYWPYITDTDDASYASDSPTLTDTTGDIGYLHALSSDPQITIYGNTLPSQNLAVMHAWYLYVPVSGLYTLTFEEIYTNATFWLGTKAYTGWTSANDVQMEMNLSADTPFTIGFQLVQGTYTPMRLLWGHDSGDAVLRMTLTAPDGSNVASSEDDGSVVAVYIVTKACDGSAPAIRAEAYGM